MQAPEISNKERSELIIKFYFVDIDKINKCQHPFCASTLKSIEGFIKKN